MMFTVEDFTNVVKFVLNRTEEEFTDMYNEIGLPDAAYIEGKFKLARNDFAFWWCNLDEEIQVKIMNYVMDFYNNKD